MTTSQDYARGWNAALDRAMQILHERCATTFDPLLKREKLSAPSCKHSVFTHDHSACVCADCGVPFRLADEVAGGVGNAAAAWETEMQGYEPAAASVVVRR